jgi:hypothetical protein
MRMGAARPRPRAQALRQLERCQRSRVNGLGRPSRCDHVPVDNWNDDAQARCDHVDAELVV